MQATENSTAEESKDSADNLSQDGLVAMLMKGEQGEPEAEESPEVVESEEEEESEVAETEELESEEEETEEDAEAEDEDTEDEDDEEDDEPTDIDLLSLSPEQIKELAKKGKSRLLDRIGDLTAKYRQAEDELQRLRERQPTKEVPQDQNPFKDLASLEEIKSKHAELEQTLETTDALLEEYEDYGPDDVIEVGNQEFTKKQLRVANRNARNAITKFLPAQAEHLHKQQQYVEANKQYVAQAKKEVPEIQDEESEIGKTYKQLVESPNIAKLKEVAPELGVDVEYILAHAVRSMVGKPKPKVSKGAGKKLKVKPPASPVGAGSAKQGGGANNKVDALYQKFLSTGSERDFVAYETAKRSQ